MVAGRRHSSWAHFLPVICLHAYGTFTIMDEILGSIQYDEQYAARLDKNATIRARRHEFIIPSKADLKRKTLSEPRKHHHIIQNASIQ